MNEVFKFDKYLKWQILYEQSAVSHNFWELCANLGIQMAQQSK